MKARDPRNWVWNYRDVVPENQLVTMNEELSDDGKRHVFLNPKHKPQIDAFLAKPDDV